MELLNQLTQNLGITEGQARGGVGLIMKMAQQKLNPGDFNQVTGAIPGLDSLVRAAPEPSPTRKAVGDLTSATGKDAGPMTNLASLTDGFSKLGLASPMITRFIPIVLSFVQAKGGSTTRDILEKVLR